MRLNISLMLSLIFLLFLSFFLSCPFLPSFLLFLKTRTLVVHTDCSPTSACWVLGSQVRTNTPGFTFHLLILCEVHMKLSLFVLSFLWNSLCIPACLWFLLYMSLLTYFNIDVFLATFISSWCIFHNAFPGYPGLLTQQQKIATGLAKYTHPHQLPQHLLTLPSRSFHFTFLKTYFMYVRTLLHSSDTPEENIQSH